MEGGGRFYVFHETEINVTVHFHKLSISINNNIILKKMRFNISIFIYKYLMHTFEFASTSSLSVVF